MSSKVLLRHSGCISSQRLADSTDDIQMQFTHTTCVHSRGVPFVLKVAPHLGSSVEAYFLVFSGKVSRTFLRFVQSKGMCVSLKLRLACSNSLVNAAEKSVVKVKIVRAAVSVDPGSLLRLIFPDASCSLPKTSPFLVIFRKKQRSKVT